MSPRARSKDKAPARRDDAPRTLTEFMAHALVMEVEAAQRYTELADTMEQHNNREVATLFRKMATIEGKHAEQIMTQMGWRDAPAPPGRQVWQGFEGPETTPHGDVHYLMTPFHALELALAAEIRAERFFAHLVEVATVETVRRAARELQAEEQEHVELIRKWMDKVDKPGQDWEHDPDPPRFLD